MIGKIHCMIAILILLIACSSEAFVSASRQPDHLDLIILHNNDLHGKFEQTDRMAHGPCSIEDQRANKCYGGFARISHVVKQYRRRAEEGGASVLFFNAGDTYVGSIWFSLFMHKICSEFLNILKPDAMVNIKSRRKDKNRILDNVRLLS